MTNYERAPQMGGRDDHPTGNEPELSGVRPLIVHVDDDVDLRLLVQCIVETIGRYRLRSFHTGQEALNFCRQTRPALLITDLMRSDIDGLTLCRMIRDDEHLHALPLVVFSANWRAADQVKAFGATFVNKPTSWRALLDAIDSHLIDAGIPIPHRPNLS